MARVPRAIPERRRQQVLSHVLERRQVGVDELAEALGASRETIRRDLTALEERGLLRKVHGGATEPQIASETDFRRRMNHNLEQKRRIARGAAALVRTGDTLFVDAGTTTALFADELAKSGPVTVITNSIEVATRLWAGPGERRRIHLLGGQFEGEVSETLGPAVLEQINGFRADHAVLTAGAVDTTGGVMDFSLEEASIAKAMARNARKVTILADYSKLGRSALAHVCALTAVGALVTDRAPPSDLGTALTAAGVELIIA